MDPDPEHADAPSVELLRRWREGDLHALGRLLEDVQPWLQRELAIARGGGHLGAQDALDLAQDAVRGFLEWGPRFVPESEAQFRALLRRIGLNGLIDEQRRRARQERGGHLESNANAERAASHSRYADRSSLQPSRAAERAENVAWMRLALEFVEAEDRYLLLASEVDGASWAEIAAELGLASPDTARVRCSRLKARMARLLLDLKRGRTPKGG